MLEKPKTSNEYKKPITAADKIRNTYEIINLPSVNVSHLIK